jgi:hypothetical protein
MTNATFKVGQRVRLQAGDMPVGTVQSLFSDDMLIVKFDQDDTEPGPRWTAPVVVDVDSVTDEDSYQAYLREGEEEQARARSRAIDRSKGINPPHRWGDKLSDDAYFCDPCWFSGYADGSHRYDVPPCDPVYSVYRDEYEPFTIHEPAHA